MEFHFYYKVLGIPETAGIEQLKKAYREKVKIYHPDVSKLPDAQQLFITLTEAYEILLRRLSVEKELKNDHAGQENYSEWNELQKQWLKEQMYRIKQRAYAQSKMKFEEFKKTPTYRATKALSKISDYIILCVGFIMIIAALAGIHHQYISGEMDAAHVLAVIFVIVGGSTIILYTLYQIRK
jgi:ABC-type transport system involved in cytochrome bd biosynthesis fused ATPase/permease subunit